MRVGTQFYISNLAKVRPNTQLELTHAHIYFEPSNYAVYISKMREELRSLPKGSKKWWSLSKVLMDNAPAKSGIPSLREQGGDWIHDGKSKADLLAHSFSSKYTLPDEIEEEDEVMAEPSTKMSNFVLVRERWVVRELVHLREDQATRPDGLPAVILRKCARQLSRFVTILIRMMLLLGR